MVKEVFRVQDFYAKDCARREKVAQKLLSLNGHGFRLFFECVVEIESDRPKDGKYGSNDRNNC